MPAPIERIRRAGWPFSVRDHMEHEWRADGTLVHCETCQRPLYMSEETEAPADEDRAFIAKQVDILHARLDLEPAPTN